MAHAARCERFPGCPEAVGHRGHFRLDSERRGGASVAHCGGGALGLRPNGALHLRPLPTLGVHLNPHDQETSTSLPQHHILDMYPTYMFFICTLLGLITMYTRCLHDWDQERWGWKCPSSRTRTILSESLGVTAPLGTMGQIAAAACQSQWAGSQAARSFEMSFAAPLKPFPPPKKLFRRLHSGQYLVLALSKSNHVNELIRTCFQGEWAVYANAPTCFTHREMVSMR